MALLTPMYTDGVQSNFAWQVPAENRQHQRLALRRRTLLRMPNQLIIRALSNNISLQGMQVHCRAEQSYLILPGDGEYRAPLAEIKIALPRRGELVEFSALGRLIYSYPIDEETVAMGFQFAEIDACSETRLVSLLSNIE